MTRNEAYWKIIQIINNPQNKEKISKYIISSKEEGLGLQWYLDNLKVTLNALENADGLEKERLENSFDAALHHIKVVLKENNII